jgi:hypothetical protein
MIPADMIIALRRALSTHKGPFTVVEKYPSMGAFDNALKWNLCGGEGRVAMSELSKEVAESLAEMLNVADVACIIADNGGQVVGSPADGPIPVDLIGVSLNDFLLRILSEKKALAANLTATQERSSQLLLKARDWRKKIIELGGEDPGPP